MKRRRNNTSCIILSEDKENHNPTISNESKKKFSINSISSICDSNEYLNDNISSLNLSLALPEVLPCRDVEIQKIESFIYDAIGKVSKCRSMYIAGPPGSGKTASVQFILEKLNKVNGNNVGKSIINCLSFTNNKQMLLNKIINDLKSQTDTWNQSSSRGKRSRSLRSVSSLLDEIPNDQFNQSSKNMNTLFNKLQSFLQHQDRNHYILVLDELDHLSSSNNDLIYKLFDLATHSSDNLVLISISNSLDFIECYLPRMSTWIDRKPTVLNFIPYSSNQICEILQQRLQKCSNMFDPNGIKLCAMKVASFAGDLRRALSILKNAIDNCSLDQINSLDINSLESQVFQSKKSLVSVSSINDIISNVYQQKIIKPDNINSILGSLPLQQQIIMCSLIKFAKHAPFGVNFTLKEVYSMYENICNLNNLPIIAFYELYSMLQSLESLAYIKIKENAKNSQLSKISILISIDPSLNDKSSHNSQNFFLNLIN